MHIDYLTSTFERSIDSLMLFQTGDETPYWSDAIYYFYPQLDKERIASLSVGEKKKYISDTLLPVWQELQPTWEKKVAAYNAHWQAHRPQVEAALSDAFQVDCHNLFNDLKGYITLNPTCPRFLAEHAIDVFHLNSERGALGITLHEMIHFLWFHVWNDLFHDSYDNYEYPGTKWILSEMVVESIMRDERLSSINPYFPRENGGCVYGYFQNMIIDGKPILDTLEEMYRNHPIRDFMQRGYDYCLQHEAGIRAHIARSEQAF